VISFEKCYYLLGRGRDNISVCVNPHKWLGMNIAVLARKPLEGTVAENVLRWGTGGLNIDGCRVDAGTESLNGRWPANTLISPDPEILREFPETTSGKVKEDKGGYKSEGNTVFLQGRSTSQNQHGDSGSAARFFSQFEYTEEDIMFFDDEETPVENPKEIKLNGYLYAGDNLEYLRTLPNNSVDSVVTDPPYGLGKEPDPRKVLAAWLNDEVYQPGGKGFMGKEWDSFVPSPVLWQECLRVLKPGGHMIAFAGTRTYDWIVLGVRLAGFEIRDTISWLYGCLTPETKALTSDGPRDYRELSVGDLVVCYDPETQTYSSQGIEEIFEYEHDGELRGWEVNGELFRYTLNHRVLMEDGSFVEAQDVPSEYPCRTYSGESVVAKGGVRDRYQGKVWCLKVPTGSFVISQGGVEIPTGNSGFPKSLSVSKSIDKMAGAEREVIGKVKRWGANASGGRGNQKSNGYQPSVIGVEKFDDITAPATPEAQQWEGWGTALKPSCEPAVLARKPLEGTVAENVLKHGTGGLDIDGCRVGETFISKGGNNFDAWRKGEGREDRPKFHGNTTSSEQIGRWPANTVHDGSEAVVSEFPDVKGGSWVNTDGARVFNNEGKPTKPTYKGTDNSVGSAARFFTQAPFEETDATLFKYCSKASTSERNEGTEALQAVMEGKGNIHSTVKPVTLIEWMVKLVTPPGGTVLDPFIGSGTTGVAAELAGFRWIGCERETDYAMIAYHRIAYAVENREAILAKREKPAKPAKVKSTAPVESPIESNDDNDDCGDDGVFF